MNTKIKRKINDYRHSAFTLAEMMIVLLIMSLVLSAFLPIMTKRAKTSGTIWRYSSNNSDFYAGLGATQGAAIGIRDFATGDDAKLLINTTATTQPAILFKENNVKTGHLMMGSNHSIVLGDNNTIDTGNSNIAIGNYAISDGSSGAHGSYGIAIGNGAKATEWATMAFGNAAEAAGNIAMALGYMAKAEYTQDIAIGYNARAASNNSTWMGGDGIAIGSGHGTYNTEALGGCSIAIGSTTKAKAAGSISIGASANFTANNGDASVALGFNSSTPKGYAVAIGPNSVATGIGADSTTDTYSTAVGAGAIAGRNAASTGFGNYATALGAGAQATGSNSIAIGGGINTGLLATSKYPVAEGYSIAIGYASRAYNGGVAIGQQPTASGYDSIGIGISAQATEEATTSIGYQTKALHSHSTAIGYMATTTAESQIMLGNGEAVVIPGTLTFQTSGGVLEREVYIDANGTLTTSDAKLKNISGKSDSGLDKIKGLTVYDFTFKKDKKKTPHVGVMAQDLQKVFPNSVKKGKNGYLMIRQDEMFYAMLNSIKELDAMFSDLKAQFKSIVAKVQQLDDKIITLVNVNKISSQKIKDLEAKNKTLEARLAKLEGKLEKK